MRQRLHQPHTAGHRIGAWRSHLADDEDPLTAILLNGDGDLWVSEEALVHQFRL